MGIVVLARDLALDRLVALKLLPPELAGDAELRARFLREARTAAGLSHPNIVPIHAVEEHGDVVFFVMAYVDGETLRERVARKGRLDVVEVIPIIREVAWALALAHAKNVVHRDVKPDNVLIDRAASRALVTDFGIAQITDGTRLTQAGELVGTANYMSPEQASGDPVDPRSDLYSLGVTAFYALTGRLPFHASSVAAVLAMHVTDPPPPVRSVRENVPAALADAVDRCLSKDPAHRFQSAEELAEAIDTLGIARRETPPPIRTFLRSHDVMGSVLIGLFLGWIVFYRAEPNWYVLIAGLLSIGAVIFLGTARTLLANGFTFDDIRAALHADQRARLEEARVVRERISQKDPTVSMPGVLAAGWFGFFGGAVAVIIGQGDTPLLLNALQSSVLTFVGGVSMVIGWSLVAARRQIRGATNAGDVGEKSWLAGRLGRWLLRMAGVGLPAKGRAGPGPAHHTEVVLGSAADSIFEALPTDYRDRLAELPDVVSRLTSDAQALRARAEELTRAAADVGPGALSPGRAHHQAKRLAENGGPDAELLAKRLAIVDDIEAERSRVGQRLATVMAALENVRIDLVRLRAGLGSIEDITADLDAARRVSEDIEQVLATRSEVATGKEG